MKSVDNLKQFMRSGSVMNYFTNTSWLLGEKVLRLSLGLFVGIWVARYLGPEKFGLFSYAQSYVALFMALSALGLDSIVVKELVKNHDNRDKLLGTAFVLKLLGFLAVLILLGVTLIIQSEEKDNIILIFIIASAGLFQTLNVIDFYFQSQVLSKYVVFSNTLSLFLSSILKIYFILSEAPLFNFAYILIFDSFVLVLGYLYFYSKKGGGVKRWSFDIDIAASMLKESWPLFLSAIVVSVYMKIDQVMIQNMLGNEAVGQYAAAVRLSEACYFIPVVIASSLFPSIVNSKDVSRKLYLSRFQNLNDLMVWLAIFIAFPISIISEWLISILYGEQYYQTAGILVLHIWASVFVFMTVASGKFLVTENMANKVFYRNLVGVIVNVALNTVLIAKYGATGAAVATLTSWCCAGYLYDLMDKDTRYIFKLKSNSFNVLRLANVWKKE